MHQTPPDDEAAALRHHPDADARPDTIQWVFYKFHSCICSSDLNVRFAFNNCCIAHGRVSETYTVLCFCDFVPHMRRNAEHLATTCPAVCLPRCTRSVKLFCAWGGVWKGGCVAAMCSEWSVNAGASRALLWNTWVTPRSVVLVLAGEHRYRTYAWRVQACTLFVFFGCGSRKRLRLAFQISFVKIGGKMNLRKRRRTRGPRKPPRAFVLWHEPSKQCASDRGGRHAAERTLTDPQAWNSTLALRSFRNSKRRRRNS